MVEHTTDINLNQRQLVMYELKDYLNSINFTKQDLMGDGDVFWEKKYHAFIVNRCLSYTMILTPLQTK